MADHRVRCEVVAPSEVVRQEANAFRVLPDGSEYLLDFMLWGGGDTAKVVARVRVTSDFLPSVRERLETAHTSARMVI